MSSKSMKIVWVDLETTGLVPDKDPILEVAVVVTNTAFEEIDHLHMVVHNSMKAAMLVASGGVIRMHARSGLWTELEKDESVGLGMADLTVAAFILDHTRDDDRLPVLGGSSVHFDRSFMKVQMPLSEKLLSHQNFDTSALKMARDFAYPDVDWPKRAEVAHRALEDIRWSILAANRFIFDIWRRKESPFGAECIEAKDG